MKNDVEQSGVASMQEAGMEVNELSPEQKAVFREALAGPYSNYEAQFGKELMDRIQAIE